MLSLSAALLLGALGLLLLTDRPGLRVEYFPLIPDWKGSPAVVGISEPQVNGPDDLRALVSNQIFSVRWRGWILAESSGNYRLRVKSDEGSYLLLNGEKTHKKSSRVFLERGMHAIEIGFSQTGDETLLRTGWTPPGGEAARLPKDLLYAQRPVGLRHVVRRLLSPVAIFYRGLMGAVFLLVGLVLLRLGLGSTGARLGGSTDTRRGVSPATRKWLYGGLLVGLFAFSWLWTARFTTLLLGGDDVRYIYQALFPEKAQWFYNRYVHVYLVKAFVWLREGDGFLGARTYWSFMFSVTVTALAAGCRSLGPRLQLRTLAVTLFLLVSQTTVMGRAGAAYSDYTTMMFVTIAVVVYLHALHSEPARGRIGWHELAIGALTVAACKSKETGIILAWLPLLFLWSEGRLDLRGFARRMGFWIAGAAAGLLVLMSLDAWVLGDFWYSLNPDLDALVGLHTRRSPELGRSVRRWTMLVWSPGSAAPLQGLRYLWLLALAVPIVAVVRRKRIELCLLFAMPFVYLLLLIAVHTRAPHIFATRYLFPVLPACCLFAGAMFYDLGLEEKPWRKLLEPRTLVPMFLGCALLLLVINPARIEDLEPGGAPGKMAVWLGGMLLAGAIMALVRCRARSALVVILLLALFGPSFERVYQSLSHRYISQRGDVILYPWNEFREELETTPPTSVAISREIWQSYRMVGKPVTRQLIARVFFRRQDLEIRQIRRGLPDTDRAVVGAALLREWQTQFPDFEAAPIFDPSGSIALVDTRK